MDGAPLEEKRQTARCPGALHRRGGECDRVKLVTLLPLFCAVVLHRCCDLMMQSSTVPITRDLVFIGGGHSHAIALKQFGMNPLPGVRLTLISDVMHTPYSGMLPGYIAGLYAYDDCHIDLRPLTTWAGVRLILDRAVGLDLRHNRVMCAQHPPIAFDLLSIDVGSTPSVAAVPGAAEYAIPVKPISQFLAYWDAFVDEVKQHPRRSLSIGVVGGGAGGVELILSVQAHLQRVLHQAGCSTEHLSLHLFHRGAALLPERGAVVRRRMQRLLQQRGIHLHLKETVSEVGPDWVACESGLTVACDRLFWVTQAAAPSWLGEAGLATDQRGFIQVNDSLQSVSHPQVFAAGDVASMVNHPRPKAGVFAVRQGKPLFHNLRRALQQQPLRPFVPQTQFLILIGLGDRTAVASRGWLCWGPTRWIWRWKDHIDRVFMRQFSDLQPMIAAPNVAALPGHDTPVVPPPSAAMHCAGCGSKVGSSVLDEVLTQLRQPPPKPSAGTVLLGLEAADDAAVLRIPAGQVMVQTVDYFRALVSDPFVFGQIAAHHALSDLFAMGAEAHSALAIATLPFATEAILKETLYLLLSGAVQVLHQAGASLIGGHTTEGAELAFGLTCNGLSTPAHLWRKGGMQPGQVLLLTKALGTGTLFAADMHLKAKGRWIESAIQSMLVSNQQAAAILRQHRAIACTDVTGYGLLGHLAEMVRASQVAAQLDLAPLPILPGAVETLRQGYVSSLHPQNAQAARWVGPSAVVSDPLWFPLLVDPQTSGGLLAALPAEEAIACLKALHSQGYPESAIIGQVVPLDPHQPRIQVVMP